MSDIMHTPGPWKVGFDGYTIREDKGTHGGYYVANTAANQPDQMPENIRQRDKANARLIAAAPELLEALEMLMPQYPSRGMCDEYDRAMWENAEAAIAKATGKSPS